MTKDSDLKAAKWDALVRLTEGVEAYRKMEQQGAPTEELKAWLGKLEEEYLMAANAYEVHQVRW